MLALTVSGLLDRLGTLIPKCVIRGIQLGLGIKLALLALTRYIPCLTLTASGSIGSNHPKVRASKAAIQAPATGPITGIQA